MTDEQRSRRPIFIATLWAGASWLFFRVARSTRMTQIWALYRQSGSDRLEKQPTDLRQKACYFGDRTLEQAPRERFLMDLRVDQLCSMLMRETERQAPLSPVYFESLATALVIAIFTQANARLLEAGSLYAQDECIQKALAYIEERFHSKLRRSQMAAAAHLSDFYFSRPFRRLVGFSPWRVAFATTRFQ